MTQLLDIIDSVEFLKTIDTQVHFAYLADKYGAVNSISICPSMACTSWIPDCWHRRKMSKNVDVCPTFEFPYFDIKRIVRKRWVPYWYIHTSSICSILSLSDFFSSKVQSALARSLHLPVLLRLHPREGKDCGLNSSSRSKPQVRRHREAQWLDSFLCSCLDSINRQVQLFTKTF